MAVYVDHYRAQYGLMKMSHMIADTPDELHAMADKIGVARRCKRKIAIHHGAKEVDRAEFVDAMRRIRGTGAFVRQDGVWR